MKVKKVRVILICVLLTIAYAQTAYASGGNGDGSGDGSGGSAGLMLAATSIIDGQIEPGDSIILTFSNNVINTAVRDGNKRAITLYDDKENTVPIDVILADEQINPDAKRLITIVPLSDLSPGVTYTIAVDKSLQAKNGLYAVQDYRITFSVAGTAPEKTTETEPSEDTGQPEQTEAGQSPQPATSAETTVPANTKEQAPTETAIPSHPSAAAGTVVQEENSGSIGEPESSASSSLAPTSAPASASEPPAVADTSGTINGAVPNMVEADNLALSYPDPDLAGTKPKAMVTVMFVCAGVALCALIFILILKKRSAVK